VAATLLNVETPAGQNQRPAAAAPSPSGALVPVQPSAAASAARPSGAAAAQSATVGITLPPGTTKAQAAAASSAAALAQVLPVRQAPLGRGPIIFVLASLLVALVAGAAYIVQRVTAPPELTPEETVNNFLAAVFLAQDPARVGTYICASWDGQDAVDRTTKEVEPGAHVSWDQLRIVSTSETEASATARLGQRLADDTRPSIFRQWRFQLKKEKGWRVCEARPVGT
jgi:hypothetical protein